MCGNRIRNIIDITNIITKIINRSFVLSLIIYVLANCITLVAIDKTVAINKVLVISIIIGIEISIELKLIMSHSIIIEFWLNIIIKVKT